MPRAIIYGAICLSLTTQLASTTAAPRCRIQSRSVCRSITQSVKNYGQCYSNPCICPQDALLDYWTGTKWLTVYSADRHDEDCGCHGGSCSSPVATYITGDGLAFPQDCLNQDYACSVSYRHVASDGLKSKVPWNYTPVMIKDERGQLPRFTTMVEPTKLFAGFLKFEPAPNTTPIVAKVFRFMVGQHNHTKDPRISNPPHPNVPKHDCDERIIAFGFEVDESGAPTPLPGTPVAAQFVKRQGNLYLVRAGSTIYGVVAVSRP